MRYCVPYMTVAVLFLASAGCEERPDLEPAVTEAAARKSKDDRPSTQSALAPGGLATFYHPDHVQSIALDVADADLRRMRDALPERVYVPATFRWNDVALANVGVRYKGNSSSRPGQGHKRSFLIKFSEFVRGQRFLGLRRVALDNGVQFGSLFSERIITDILRDVGVKAPRANYARLTLNGKFQGIYVNVERIDKSYLVNRLDDAKGELYKADEGGPGADLTFIGDNPLLYRKAFEPKTDGDSRRIVQFVRAIHETPPEAFPSALREIFDVDAFLWTTGVALLAGAFDQYTGWNAHNYYLYRHSVSGRWMYLPWDLDVGFADHAFGRVPVIDGWNAGWPVPAEPRPLLERIMADDALLALYRERADHLLETYFKPDLLNAKLDALYGQIADDLADDPFPHKRATNPRDRGYDDILASMKDFFQRRYTTARAQLDDPKKTAPMAMRRPGSPAHGPPRGRRPGSPGPGDPQPHPGPPSPDAPSDLKVTASGAGRVQLAWTDNASGEGATIVQKCLGADCDDFANAVGLPGSDVTSGTDVNVQPGMTLRYRVYAMTPTPQGPHGTGPSNVVTVTVGGPTGSPAPPATSRPGNDVESIAP